MAITITDANPVASFAFGDGLKAQLMTYRILSGATSGTVTADNLKDAIAILLDNQVKFTAAPTFSGNVATLAFDVPAETAASRTLQSALTFTAVADLGQDGNSITITFTGGADHGAEVITVSGTAITIQVEDGVSTADEVKTAYDLSAAANALATVAVVGGHGSDAISAATALALQNGVTGGSRGTCLVLGR